MEKQYQEKCLLMLVHALQSYKENISEGRHNSDAERVYLFPKYQLLVSSVLMATLPPHFPGTYFTIFYCWDLYFSSLGILVVKNFFYMDVSLHKNS